MQNPLFQILPPSILVKTKSLADKERLRQELEDVAGRNLGRLSAVVVGLLIFNSSSAMHFIGTINSEFPIPRSIKPVLFFVGLFVMFGGMWACWSLVEHWMILNIKRRIGLTTNIPAGGIQLNHWAAWIPMLLFVVTPVLFTAIFNLESLLSFTTFGIVLVIAAFKLLRI